MYVLRSPSRHANLTAHEAEIEVSVVMPCLNEARTLGRCIDKARGALQRLGVPGEVIVADNGSTDGSPDIARIHEARFISVNRKGYGCALRGRIEAARGRVKDQRTPYLIAAQDKQPCPW